MLDAQNKHYAGLFANVAKNPVIANTITPQPATPMTQRFPEAERLFVGANASVHIVENVPLHCPVYSLQVFFNPWVVFNGPSQGFCATGSR